MGFYSFTAFAKEPTGLENPFILLDEGFNVFNAHTDNLPKLLEDLLAVGAYDITVNDLRQEAATLEENLFLPTGEEPELSKLEQVAKLLATRLATPEGKASLAKAAEETRRRTEDTQRQCEESRDRIMGPLFGRRVK